MEEFLWVEKYRPHTVKDTLLPANLKKTFQKFVDQDNVPNLLLSGGPGIGKTTIAKAVLDELGADWIIINGSLEGRNIDTLRNEITNYASSSSLRSGGRKYVILDEADYMNPNSIQPALRNFMEDFSDNCGFILTCNYKAKIIDPLHSRCSVVDFTIPSKEKAALSAQFFKRVVKILKDENVEFENAAVAQIILKFFPDFRRVLNELQRYSASGKIDSGILSNLSEKTIQDLVVLLKNKEFSKVRAWVEENGMDSADLFRSLYDNCILYMVPKSIPALVLILAKYQYQDGFALDKRINTSACLLEIMSGCLFK